MPSKFVTFQLAGPGDAHGLALAALRRAFPDAAFGEPSDLAQSGVVLGPAAALHTLRRENDRLRGDLSTISRRLAHDLRTPLNAISTASEALGEPAPGSDPMAALLAKSISDSVTEAATLVERLSVVLRASVAALPPQPVAMDEIVWGAMQRLESRILKAGATIVKPPHWPALAGVPPWLEVVWENLLLNSLQHGGPQARIELGCDETDGEWRCWLRDRGRGVAPGKRARLFHPFERLHELSAPRGYGLPIVHRLIALQGGRCGYEAEPAPGGTFFFTLPAA